VRIAPAKYCFTFFQYVNELFVKVQSYKVQSYKVRNFLLFYF
jgi:hypothetical protein